MSTDEQRAAFDAGYQAALDRMRELAGFHSLPGPIRETADLLESYAPGPSLERQYEAAQRRNRMVPDSYSLAPRNRPEAATPVPVASSPVGGEQP